MYYNCDTKKNRRITTQRHGFSIFAEQVLTRSQYPHDKIESKLYSVKSV